MTCLSVMYPNGPGIHFDQAYYEQKHRALVLKLLSSHGITRYEILQGVAGGAPGSTAPYAAVGNLYFRSLADFQTGIAAHGPELMADIPNFTNSQAQLQVSEVV